jgi:N-acetylneuraminate synthase/N,N'-diacetyllegionaminate synthase
MATSNRAFAIGGRAIGQDEQPYMIAELGVNHDGDPAKALRLVDAAADAGADAVKFQTFRADALATAGARQAEYQRARASAGSQREMLQSLELPIEGLRAAFERARERGIAAFSTPFDVGSVATLVELGVPALKVGSGDLTNLLLLRSVAAAGLPLILSTGMATLDEVDAAVAAVRSAGDAPLALLHCLSAYPAPPEETNLRAIPAMRERYGVEIGFSDHTTGMAAPIASIALGATIIEKHLTLDHTMPGPDHAASMEPDQLRALTSSLGVAHAALGSGWKVPQPSEADTRQVARRSLVLRHELRRGARIAEEDLDAKRPADGISPMRLDEVVGRRLAHDLAADATLLPDDLDPPLESLPPRAGITS